MERDRVCEKMVRWREKLCVRERERVGCVERKCEKVRKVIEREKERMLRAKRAKRMEAR
jgi:hypothetical protein